MDLFHASMARVESPEGCFLDVRILFAAPVGDTPFRGGVVFFQRELPLLDPPSSTWYFDNVGNLSFNFGWKGQDAENPLYWWVDKALGDVWVDINVRGYKAFVEGGELVLRIPCQAVREPATWMVASTNPQGNKCDALGVENDQAALPLPR